MVKLTYTRYGAVDIKLEALADSYGVYAITASHTGDTKTVHFDGFTEPAFEEAFKAEAERLIAA